jgi:hypothetical protein
MGLPAFAEIDDLIARRPSGVTDRDRPRALAALDDASTLIRTLTGQDWTTTDDDDHVVLAAALPPIFLTVACAAARRTLDNPDGLQSESLGGYSAQFSLGDIYLTDTEVKFVRRGAGISEVFTLATTRDPVAAGLETPPVLCAVTGQEFVDVDPPGDPLLWGGPAE